MSRKWVVPYAPGGSKTANEDKKDFNAMLNNGKDMPKIQIITDEASIKNTAETECILRRRRLMTWL